jgi:hypothetical protein
LYKKILIYCISFLHYFMKKAHHSGVLVGCKWSIGISKVIVNFNALVIYTICKVVHIIPSIERD